MIQWSTKNSIPPPKKKNIEHHCQQHWFSLWQQVHIDKVLIIHFLYGGKSYQVHLPTFKLLPIYFFIFKVYFFQWSPQVTVFNLTFVAVTELLQLSRLMVPWQGMRIKATADSKLKDRAQYWSFTYNQWYSLRCWQQLALPPFLGHGHLFLFLCLSLYLYLLWTCSQHRYCFVSLRNEVCVWWSIFSCAEWTSWPGLHILHYPPFLAQGN